VLTFDSHGLPELDDDAQAAAVEGDATSIANTLEQCLTSLQPIVAPDESTNAFESVSPDMCNFESLINLRFDHQRIQAKTGVRKHTRNSRDPEPGDSRISSQSPDTTKQKELAQQLGRILKEHRERGISTGTGRALRWQPGRKPAMHSEEMVQPPELRTGNALNAAEVANAQAKKVSNICSPPSRQVLILTCNFHTSYLHNAHEL
jgi:hypothetical protein